MSPKQIDKVWGVDEVRALATQALGPELRFLDPCKKVGSLTSLDENGPGIERDPVSRE